MNVLRTLLAKSFLPALLVLIVTAAPAWAQKMPKPPIRQGVRAGDLAYDFTVSDLAGKPFRLSELRGERVVHVVFWATWCVPCLQEMPRLLEIYDAYHSQGLEILGVVVAMNQTKEGVQEFVDKRQLPFPVLWDHDLKVMSRYRVDSIPQNFIIDRDGIIKYAGGPLPHGYEEMLRSLLAAPAAAPTAALR